jgi:hypothetical protein
MNDDFTDFEAKLRDPALIETREEVAAIFEKLNESIVSISGQLELYRIEITARPPSDERRNWAIRATHALSCRQNEVHRVYMRDKELRNVARLGQKPPKQPGEGLAKQERLRVEAEARKATANANEAAIRAQREDTVQRRSVAQQFMTICQEQLNEIEFNRLLTAAKSRAAALRGYSP